VIYGYRPEPPVSWSGTRGYLERLEAARPAVNVVTLVPNGQLRLAAVGLEQRPAAAAELATMSRLLEQCLEEGAAGFSTGLEYAAEAGASEEEVTALCRVVARADGLYATHTRDRDSRAVAAIEEAIRTAARAGVRLQISHITPRGGMADTARALELVDAATRQGQDVAFDMHTRFFGTTYLKVLLPLWALEGTDAEVARRLAAPAERERIRRYRSNPIAALDDWSRVVLLDNPAYPELSRQSLAEIAQAWGRPPFECALDLLAREAACGQLRRQMVILHTYDEALLGLTYDHPLCSVGSDATALAPDGPLAGTDFHGAYTWAAWFYRRMVRETGRFTPEAGVRKLSGASAERLGLSSRGILEPGRCADVAVFDPRTFGETGTTFEPSRLAVGMRHVLVNGCVTMRDGRLTGARAGAVLRAPL
jgi:N-acyl-D-aspartate/D-glutamate deacylase